MPIQGTFVPPTITLDAVIKDLQEKGYRRTKALGELRYSQALQEAMFKRIPRHGDWRYRSSLPFLSDHEALQCLNTSFKNLYRDDASFKQLYRLIVDYYGEYHQEAVIMLKWLILKPSSRDDVGVMSKWLNFLIDEQVEASRFKDAIVTKAQGGMVPRNTWTWSFAKHGPSLDAPFGAISEELAALLLAETALPLADRFPEFMGALDRYNAYYNPLDAFRYNYKKYDNPRHPRDVITISIVAESPQYHHYHLFKHYGFLIEHFPFEELVYHSFCKFPSGMYGKA